MIQTRNLSKNFGTLKAVDDFNLDIRQGEFFAFLGPNAAGKTTTIKMLTGLIRPSRGSCTVYGHDIQKMPEAAKTVLSYVPDFPFLYDKLTSCEFMQFTGDLFNMEKSAVASKTAELFETFHLENYVNELTENLSHGTRQRLVIASALLHDPKVFVIDEPMVGLDPTHARIVKNELKKRSRAGHDRFSFHPHAQRGRGNGRPDRDHQPRAPDRAGDSGGIAQADRRERRAGESVPLDRRCGGTDEREARDLMPRPVAFLPLLGQKNGLKNFS